MNLVLKRFSQDVDLSNPDRVEYYLVFETNSGELRLPVQKETTEALVKALYAKGAESGELDTVEPQEFDDPEPEPEEDYVAPFDEDEDLEELDMPTPTPRTIKTEEDVPSL